MGAYRNTRGRVVHTKPPGIVFSIGHDGPPSEPDPDLVERAAIAAFACDEAPQGTKRSAVLKAWHAAMDYQQDRYRRIAAAVIREVG